MYIKKVHHTMFISTKHVHDNRRYGGVIYCDITKLFKVFVCIHNVRLISKSFWKVISEICCIT